MSASGDLYRCSTCGASLSLEQLRGTNCPFCHTVFPHHGAAVQQAALVNQIMAQQYAQAGYQGPPPQVAAQYGAPPPQYGAPQYGAPQYGAPPQHGQPFPQGFNPTAQVERAVKTSMIVTFVALGAGLLITAILVVVLLVLH